MHGFKTPESSCPGCGCKMDMALSVSPDFPQQQPRPGDISICIKCGELLVFDRALSLTFVCHKSCKVSGEKQEALDCQTVDADCNDCRHFKRGSIVPHSRSIQEQIRTGQHPNFSSEVWSGHCLKFDTPTTAFPKKWTGRACFEHRRAPIKFPLHPKPTTK